MFPKSYVILFAFHPKFNIDRIIIQQSFSQFLGKLTDISCLTTDMLKNVSPITAEQLLDCALNVTRKKDKFAIS